MVDPGRTVLLSYLTNWLKNKYKSINLVLLLFRLLGPNA